MTVKQIDEPTIKIVNKGAATGAIFTLALATLMTSFAISSINIILPELVSKFDTTFAQVQWVIISYMLFLTLTLVMAGRLSDTLGHKRVFLIGIAIFTISAGVCGLTENLWLLVSVRAVQGIGGAILIAVSMAIASNTFPENKMASAMGLIGSMSAIGTGLGPVLGGFIVEIFYWQIVFLINLPMGLLTYSLAQKYFPRDIPIKKSAATVINYKSVFLLFLAIFTYTLSIKLAGKGFATVNLILFLSSLLTLLILIAVERQSNPPLIRLTTIKNSELLTSLISNFIVSTVVMASLVVGPFYLVISLELNTLQAGIAMAASPLTVAIISFFIGEFSNQGNLKKFIILGLCVLTLASAGMTSLKVADGLSGYLLCLITMAAGYATFLSTNNTLTMASTSLQIRGSVSGILNLSRNLGLLTGASIMSTIFASSSNITNTATANNQMIESGLHAVYQVAVGLLIGAIAVQIINKYAIRH